VTKHQNNIQHALGLTEQMPFMIATELESQIQLCFKIAPGQEDLKDFQMESQLKYDNHKP
jgi:hypothetical protein